MEFFETFLNVLAIIGIIIAGGFLIFFIGDMLLNLIEPKYPKPEKEQVKAKKKQSFTKQQNLDYEKGVQNFKEGTITEFVPDEETEFSSGFKSEDDLFKDDFNHEFEQRRFNPEKSVKDFNFRDEDFLKSLKDSSDKSDKKDSDFNNLFNDNDFNFTDDFDFNFLNENAESEKLTETSVKNLQENFDNENRYIDIRGNEMQSISERPKNLRNEFFETFEKTSEFENFKNPYEQYAKPDIKLIENNEKFTVKPVEIQSEKVVDSFKPENDNKNNLSTYSYIEIDKIGNVDAGTLNFETINESRLNEEIKLLKQELYAQKLEYERLKKEAELNDSKLKSELSELEKLYEQAEQQEVKSAPLLTIEEYENRIEVLKARLKANEKELKANKKEFIPLRRVRKNLDNDKKKLRRREALVAKQKVMLYGVNNISEIDEEKAKKLAEDLDLLDGLKISVQHCEEVMEANKERYPILETTYRILTTVNKDLKDDIAESEANIRKLNGTDEDSNTDGGIVLEAKAILNGNKEDATTTTKKKRKKPDDSDTEGKKPGLQDALLEDNISNNITEEIRTADNEINVILTESDLAEKDVVSNKDAFNLESDAEIVKKDQESNKV